MRRNPASSPKPGASERALASTPRASETLRFQALTDLGDAIREAAHAAKLTPQQWMLAACTEKLERRHAQIDAAQQRLAS